MANFANQACFQMLHVTPAPASYSDRFQPTVDLPLHIPTKIALAATVFALSGPSAFVMAAALIEMAAIHNASNAAVEIGERRA